MNAQPDVTVPRHLTAEWLGEELARKRKLRREGKSTKTNYIKPKHVSIRESIALAQKLQKS